MPEGNNRLHWTGRAGRAGADSGLCVLPSARPLAPDRPVFGSRPVWVYSFSYRVISLLADHSTAWVLEWFRLSHFLCSSQPIASATESATANGIPRHNDHAGAPAPRPDPTDGQPIIHHATPPVRAAIARSCLAARR